MDSRTLRVLEYDKVKALLRQQCASSLGEDLVRRLEPAVDPRWIAERLAETSEACALLAECGSFPLQGLCDIGGLCRRAAIGAILDGEDLLRIRQVLQVVRLVKAFVPQDGRFPRLSHLTERLGEYEQLERDLLHWITDEGTVNEDASPELRRLSARARIVHGQVRSKLEQILRAPAYRTAIQDPIVTIRSGRYCIPVKAQRQAGLRGIVHDRSASGATVFLEPEAVVELNNEVHEIELERQDEIRRILQRLTQAVGERSASLQADLETLGTIDFIASRARLSEMMDGVEPKLTDDGAISLKRARHPLLSGEVVPIDFWIGREFRTLVITGPNTGGKTVTIKTVGLLVLMAQSGLHIPADEGSEISVFRQVFADIGDEQSIQQSLSTFSSHMTQIIRAVKQVKPNALVLLDEIGAGTDPEEGAALAQAILQHLHEQGALTVATTHYGALKTFAYNHKEMENASVEFDPQTLCPTFHLRIGVPGASNALLIARRLGLPHDIINTAREGLSKERIAVEKAIRRMEKSRRRLERKRRAVGRNQSHLDDLIQEYESKLEALEQQRRTAMSEGFREAREVVRRAEQEANAILAQLRKQPNESKITQQLKQQLTELDERIQQAQARHAEAAHPAAPQEAVESVEAGERVHVRSIDKDGDVICVRPDGQVDLQVGIMQITVPLSDLQRPKETPQQQAPSKRIEIQKALQLPDELHVRGMTVEEAKIEVDKYLDDAFLAGVRSVRIVHGKGTGTLRRGLHEFFRHHPRVRAFHMAEQHEGGDGVTIVEL